VERKRARAFVGTCLAAAALAAAACGSPPVRDATPLAALFGAEWTLVELDGAALPPGTGAPTAQFEADAVSGFGGCNRYRGGVRELSPGAVEIGPLAGTMMMCEPPAMELEGRFHAALERAKALALADGRLSLAEARGAAPRLVFVRR
jgi:putative lipoprotein